METKISTVNPKTFDALYSIYEAPSDIDWKVLFADAIHASKHTNYNSNFWYIGDFRVGSVIASGGDLVNGLPKNAGNLIGLHPLAFENFFHPKDVDKMKAYIVYIAQFFASKKDDERYLYRPSITFRMKNQTGNYTWRIMSYPMHLYIENKPVLLMCRVDEVHHLVQQQCKLYILDCSKSSQQMYYCEDTSLELKLITNLPQLSPREIEILKLLSKGYISKEIAVQLSISKNTVENHKQNMFEKCNVRKVTELIHFAVENKLI